MCRPSISHLWTIYQPSINQQEPSFDSQLTIINHRLTIKTTNPPSMKRQISQPVTIIKHQSTIIHHQWKINKHQSSIIKHETTIIKRQPATIKHQPPSINYYWTLIINWPSTKPMKHQWTIHQVLCSLPLSTDPPGTGDDQRPPRTWLSGWICWFCRPLWSRQITWPGATGIVARAAQAEKSDGFPKVWIYGQGMSRVGAQRGRNTWWWLPVLKIVVFDDGWCYLVADVEGGHWWIPVDDGWWGCWCSWLMIRQLYTEGAHPNEAINSVHLLDVNSHVYMLQRESWKPQSCSEV